MRPPPRTREPFMSQAATKPQIHRTAAEYKAAAIRGQATMKAIYYVDGQPHTAEDVMSRTGWTKVQTLAVIRRERDSKRIPLTWARFEEIAALRRSES